MFLAIYRLRENYITRERDCSIKSHEFTGPKSQLLRNYRFDMLNKQGQGGIRANASRVQSGSVCPVMAIYIIEISRLSLFPDSVLINSTTNPPGRQTETTFYAEYRTFYALPW